MISEFQTAHHKRKENREENMLSEKLEASGGQCTEACTSTHTPVRIICKPSSGVHSGKVGRGGQVEHS